MNQYAEIRITYFNDDDHFYRIDAWKTDDEKIGFLQKYGWLIKDATAKKYSAKYK